MVKKILKRIFFWNLISLENKNKIRNLFGMKTTRQRTTKKVVKKKSNVSHFNSLFNKFSVFKADFNHYEVGLYFAGGMGSVYQVEQWIGTLQELKQEKNFLLIIRDKGVFTWLAKNTDFTLVYCLTLADLTKFYEESNLKCILYVNNGFKNFQSLMVESALHVHINHGESDKSSTATHQAKAYDYVLIVSDAGYNKYQSNLINIDMSSFIKVGRPQLDHIKTIAPFDKDQPAPIVESINLEDNVVEESEKTNIIENSTPVEENIDRKVILYAPTWEATHDSMNFTSLNEYGLELVSKILDNPNYYLVYKPHPNTGSRDTVTKNINNKIKKLLKDNHKGEVVSTGDINSLYAHVDLAIFDNSAVAIDYLQVDKPMLMTDMFHKMDKREGKPTIVNAVRLLSLKNLSKVEEIIQDEIENDTLRDIRNKVKIYFLGNYNYEKKESTQKFIETILEICDERDKLYNLLVEHNMNKQDFIN